MEVDLPPIVSPRVYDIRGSLSQYFQATSVAAKIKSYLKRCEECAALPES
jgi:hypothetical protein